MNIPHPLGILAPSQSALEGVDPKFVRAGIFAARDKTIAAFEAIKSLLKEGMMEEDGRKLGLQVFADLGVQKHWHTPHVRFGSGTTLNFSSSVKTDHRLTAGDACYIDLGPIWNDPQYDLAYEGDYGDSFVFGENAEAAHCGDVCRKLFAEAKTAWKDHAITGLAIYEMLKQRASEEGFQLLEEVGGHRIGDFPHHRFTKSNLSHFAFIPTSSLWILEVQIIDPKNRFGAFFEDILE